MKTPLLACWLSCSILLLGSACKATGQARAGGAIEYRERVTFTCEAPDPYYALQVENRGPGAVEVRVEGWDGREAVDGLLPWSRASFPFEYVRRVTLAHAGAPPAELVWSAPAAAEDRIEVSID